MHDEALRRAFDLGLEYLDSVDRRPVFPTVTSEELDAALDGPLPLEGTDPVEVIEDLARGAAPGLVGSQGGRYFGFVTGGAVPAALGADWLTSAWDQNSFSYVSSPAASVIERIAARWLLEILDLPQESSVAFVTGCQMAHVTALAAARHRVLDRAGWDVASDGLHGAPPIAVVAAATRHSTVDRACRLLGLGNAAITTVATDASGRMSVDALEATLSKLHGHIIVVAQAGEVNTGTFDPMGEIATLAADHDAWLHVDAAFGMWARTEASVRHLTDGIERADSWAFDAHKWLNVPYDSGIAVVADQAAHAASMAYAGAYLMPSKEQRDAMDWTPDASRRARGIPIYAALRSLGRNGVAELVSRCCAHARTMAAGLETLGLEIVNDVVLNQVLVRAGDEAETDRILAGVQKSGEAWMSGTTWDGRKAIRISISGWATTQADVERTVTAFERVLASLAQGDQRGRS